MRNLEKNISFDWQMKRHITLNTKECVLIKPLVNSENWFQSLTRVSGRPLHHLTVVGRKAKSAIRLNQQALLIVADRKVAFTCHLPFYMAAINLDLLCSHLAFTDASMTNTQLKKTVPEKKKLPAVISTDIPQLALKNFQTLEQWLSLIVLKQNNQISDLLQFLRSKEIYQFVQFLMAVDVQTLNLEQLAKQYGLSYSQFCKLGKRAFSMPIRNRLNEWRAAKSILSLIENDNNILEVALENGYSSASHISSDIKRTFGVSPSVFNKTSLFRDKKK